MSLWKESGEPAISLTKADADWLIMALRAFRTDLYGVHAPDAHKFAARYVSARMAELEARIASLHGDEACEADE